MKLKVSRVQIWGLKNYIHEVIPFLHNFGKMQIDDIGKIKDISVQSFKPDDEMRNKQEKLDLLIANINGLIELFKPIMRSLKQDSTFKSNIDGNIKFIHEEVEKLLEQVQYLNNKKKNQENELALFSKYLDILNAIAPIMPESGKDPDNGVLCALVPSSDMQQMQLAAEELKSITGGNFQMLSVKVRESTYAVAGVYSLEFSSQVENFLENNKIIQLSLPKEFSCQSAGEPISKIEERIELSHQEIDDIDNHLSKIASNWLPSLRDWEFICKEHIEELEVYLKAGETDFAFTLVGWIPTEYIQDLKDEIKIKFGGNVILDIVSIPPEYRNYIPVALKNPEFLKPFENLVKLRGSPKYSDIDPSTLVAIFMPLFFGIMIGDVGYGIIMFLISLAFINKVSEGLIHDFLKTLQIGSIWSILFGFLFGEYFGTIGESLGIEPIWISRSDPSNINTLMLLAISIGAGHILIGLIIGIIVAFKNKQKKELLERSGTFIGITGLVYLILVLTNILPNGSMLIGWIGLGFGLIISSIARGVSGIFLGPIEFVGVIGNILSYLRLTALGLASVYLAQVANDMAGRVGNIFVGIIIAVVIHGLNIIIGILSPTIQGLRLQYVEFFKTFFEGGHNPFSPFRKRSHKANLKI